MGHHELVEVFDENADTVSQLVAPKWRWRCTCTYMSAVRFRDEDAARSDFELHAASPPEPGDYRPYGRST